MRPVLTTCRLLALLSVLAVGAGLPMTAGASGERYRLELIVFRNVGVPATPVDITTPRRFGEAFDLDEPAMPEDPVLIDKQDGTFANIWSRLDRLAEYEPLLRVTWEQSMFDFHPPVRVHGEELLAETIIFDAMNVIEAPSEDTVPGDEDGFTGQEDALIGEPSADSRPFFVARYYRLDGKVQLRRSRFLHVDLDLEYRLDGPAWQREFGLPPGFEWIGEGPDYAWALPASPEPDLTPGSPTPGPTPINALQPMTAAGPVPTEGNPVTASEPPAEPFQVHRLEQSRQVRTNVLHYFDSAFLSAIVRVTEIADEET